MAKLQGNTRIYGNAVIDANAAIGNVLTDGLYYSNGQPWNFGSTYGNSNVANYLDSNSNVTITVGAANIATQGNISAGYVLGNGAFLTGLPQAYGNANVANYLPTYTGNIAAGNAVISNNAVILGNLTVLGNTTTINANNLVINDKDIVLANGATDAITANGAGIIINGANANILYDYAGNSLEFTHSIRSANNISAVGNISADYFSGNGALLTGLYSNADVANYLPTYSGNISANYFLGNGAFLTGLPAQYSNANVFSYLGSNSNVVITTTGNITGGNLAAEGNLVATGNVTGTYILGNGALLTGLGATYSNANVANYLPVYTGNISAGNAAFSNNVVITGNLSVLGNSVVINDRDITLANGAATPAEANGGGILIAGANANILYISASNSFQMSHSLQVANNINAVGTVTAANLLAANLTITNTVTFTDIIANTITANIVTANTSVVNANLSVGGNIVAESANIVMLADPVPYSTVDVPQSTNNTFPYSWYWDVSTTDANITQTQYILSLIGPLGSMLGTVTNVNYISGTDYRVSFTTPYSNINNVATAEFVVARSESVLRFQDDTVQRTAFQGYEQGNFGVVAATIFRSNVYQYANGANIDLGGTYGNADVANYLPVYGGNVGNGSGYIFGNGAFLTGLAATYGNTDVANYLASNSNVEIVTTGNITIAGIARADTFLADGNIVAEGRVEAANINSNNAAFNTATVVGNLTANYFLGNGAFLTGLPQAYSNANVANYLPTYTGNLDSLTGNVITTGNIAALYVLGNGRFLTGIFDGPNAYSNANVANYLLTNTGNIAAGNVIVTGITYSNVTGDLTGNSQGIHTGNVVGNISGATASFTGNLTAGNIIVSGVEATVGNIIGAAALELSNSNTAISVANVGSLLVRGPSEMVGNVVVLGNFRVDGNTTFLSTTNLNVANKRITLADGAAMATDINEAGLLFGNANLGSEFASLLWANIDSSFHISGGLVTDSNVSAGNVSANGQITATGNVQGTYLLGNITQATGYYEYGNSNVANYLPTYTGNLVSLTGNVTTAANINAAGGTYTGNVTTLGNITAAYFIGNIVGNITGNIAVTGSNQQVLFNSDGNIGATPGLTFDYASNLLSVSGNVSAVGNISGDYLLGNGRFLAGLPEAYSNANVFDYLGSNSNVNIITTGNITANTVTVTGAGNSVVAGTGNVILRAGNADVVVDTTANITANYFLGNITQATGYYEYGNSNVANYLPTYTGNLAGSNLIISSNAFVQGTRLRVDGYIEAFGNVNIANNLNLIANANFSSNLILGGYANVAGNVTSQGNITGDYILGNGRFLTGLPEAYSNANVANYLPTYTGNLASLTGNVTTTANVNASGGTYTGNVTTPGNIHAAYFIGNIIGNITGNIAITGSNQQVLFNSDGNIGATPGLTFNYASNLLSVSGNVSAVGNISGDYLLGNGRFLTGIFDGPDAYSNANVANYLPTYTGNITAGNITVYQNAVVQGNLTVLGNTTTINANTLSINDRDIVVANGATSQSEANGAGIIVGSNIANILYLNSSNTWTFYPGISTSANIAGDYILGNGRFLTGLPEAYSNANVANYLPTYTGNLASLTGNVTTTANVNAAGGTISANLTVGGNAAVGGTVFANNIITSGTGVTTITSGSDINLNAGSGLGLVDINGSVTANGNVTANYFLGNGAFLTGIAGAYSNANVANYLPTYTGNLDSLTGNVITTGNVTANYFLGNGAFLTGLGATYSNANVANYLPTYTGNLDSLTGNVITTGNVTANFYLGNIRFANGGYSNANVDGYLPTYTGNILFGNLRAADGGVGEIRVTSGSLPEIGTVINGNGFYAGFGVPFSNLEQSSVVIEAATGNIRGTNLNLTGNINAIGNITTSANISANYVLGNGAFLTGLAAAYSNANVANYLASNANISFVATGNVLLTNDSGEVTDITGGNIVLRDAANGFVTTLTYKDYSLVRDTGDSTTFSPGSATVLANLMVANNAASIKIFANAESGNTSVAVNTGLLKVTDAVGANANVQAQYYYGNGAFLTGLPEVYSNANVANYLPTYTGNLDSLTGNVITTGNITADYFLGNGAFLTGLDATYSNATVANYLPTYTGNLDSLTGNVITTANIQADYVLGNGAIFTGNVDSSGDINALANLNVTANAVFSSNVIVAGYANVAGNINATGNVAANYFLGNGRYLTGLDFVTVPSIHFDVGATGIDQTFSNSYLGFYNSGANLSVFVNGAYLSSANYSLTNNTLTVYSNLATGDSVDIAASSFSNASANFVAYSNSDVKSYLSDFNGDIIPNANATYSLGNTTNQWANIYATGNITAGYVLGNGAFLTGLPEAYSNANVANYLSTYTGNIRAGNLNIINNAVVQGNLEVQGTTTTINANTLSISDKYIIVANGATTESQANGAGIVVAAGNVANFIYLNTPNSWVSSHNIVAPGIDATGNITTSANISASYVLGNGAFLTGLAATYGNANVANYLPVFGGNANVGNLLISGSIVGNANVTGYANITGNINALANLNVTANAVFSSNTLIAGYSNITGNINALANLNVTANGRFSSNVIVAGYANVTGNVNATGNVVATANVIGANGIFARGNTNLATSADEFVRVGSNTAVSPTLGFNSANSQYSGLRFNKVGTQRWYLGTDNSTANGQFVLQGPAPGLNPFTITDGAGNIRNSNITILSSIVIGNTAGTTPLYAANNFAGTIAFNSGQAGQVLTSAGDGRTPFWGNPSIQGWNGSSTSLSGGSVATVVFTNTDTLISSGNAAITQAANGTFTCTRAGFYTISYSYRTNQSIAGIGEVTTWIAKNGNDGTINTRYGHSGTGNAAVSTGFGVFNGTTSMFLDVNDFVRLQAYIASGTITFLGINIQFARLSP